MKIPITCFKCDTALDSPRDNLETDLNCPKCHITWRSYVISNSPIKSSNSDLLPQAREDDGDASCYNHESNLASGGCSECGRLLCAVCSLKREGKIYCPSCWELGKAGTIYTSTKSRIRYDFGATAIGAYCFFASCFSCVMAPGGMLLLVWHFMSPPSVYRNGPAILVPLLAVLLIIVGTGLTFLNVLGQFAAEIAKQSNQN